MDRDAARDLEKQLAGFAIGEHGGVLHDLIVVNTPRSRDLRLAFRSQEMQFQAELWRRLQGSALVRIYDIVTHTHEDHHETRVNALLTTAERVGLRGLQHREQTVPFEPPFRNASRAQALIAFLATEHELSEFGQASVLDLLSGPDSQASRELMAEELQRAHPGFHLQLIDGMTEALANMAGTLGSGDRDLLGRVAGQRFAAGRAVSLSEAGSLRL